MRSHWVNAAPYFRCRFPAEYVLAKHIDYLLRVSLREDAIIGHVDGWLALEFAPHRLAETIRDLATAQDHATTVRRRWRESARNRFT